MDIQTLYNHFLQHPTICTDTRKITSGCLFFALQGENFDGNRFAQEALQQGAAYAIVSDPTWQGDHFLQTTDTLKTLQDLAHFHRMKLHVPVIAITGSNGKTTTKELITEALSTTFKVHATIGNFNNHIGVPLTLLKATLSTEIIVCEMGANHLGEIKQLCAIAAPTHGIITNIGHAHIEGFGSIDGVQKAKGELFDFIRDQDGYGFVNVDDPRVKTLGNKLKNKSTFGLDASHAPEVHLAYQTTPDDEGLILKNNVDEVVIRSKLFGKYNASNILAAYVIGLHFGIDNHTLSTALSNFVSKSNRSEKVIYNSCVFIMDAYNANPSSMELSLLAFAEKHPTGWIILGDMKELGSFSADAHQQIIFLISQMKFGKIYLIGNHFKEALQSSLIQDGRINLYDNIEGLKLDWDWSTCAGQTFFVKGSRSMKLEQILQSS